MFGLALLAYWITFSISLGMGLDFGDAAFLATLVALVVYVLSRLARSLLARRRLERELPRRPVPLRRRGPPPPPLYLEDLVLLIEKRGKNPPERRLGRVVNPEEDGQIRPVAVILVDQEGLVGRRLPLEFNLVGPRGGVRFECTPQPILRLGVNRIVPRSTFPIRETMLDGVWRIRLWAGDHAWGEQEFSVTRAKIGDLADQVVGADMEVSRSAGGLAQELAGGTSIDELLED